LNLIKPKILSRKAALKAKTRGSNLPPLNGRKHMHRDPIAPASAFRILSETQNAALDAENHSVPSNDKVHAICASVDLTVNVHTGDAPFFEATYRHLVRQLDYPFRTRRIAVDRGQPRGRFVGAAEPEYAIDNQLSRLLADQVVDVVENIDWSVDTIARVMTRHFGNPTTAAVDDRGRPVFQYLWAVDQCDADYVLHYDSDILVHFEDGGAWIDESVAAMRANPKLLGTVQEAGPPRATTLMDWIFGYRPRTPANRWQRPQDFVFSTRYFLIDRVRFLDLSPLRSACSQRLEDAVTQTMHERGLELWAIADDRNWAIHPETHNANHTRYLIDLIRLVEAGRQPFRRTANRWDIRTGRRFIPWRIAIERDRLLRR
jgi:hypothetical protein